MTMIRVANQNFTVWQEITKGHKERLQNLPEYGERVLLEFRTTPAQPVPFRAFGKLVRMNIDDAPAFLLELYGRFVSARKVARYAQRPEDVNAAH